MEIGILKNAELFFLPVCLVLWASFLFGRFLFYRWKRTLSLSDSRDAALIEAAASFSKSYKTYIALHFLSVAMMGFLFAYYTVSDGSFILSFVVTATALIIMLIISLQGFVKRSKNNKYTIMMRLFSVWINFGTLILGILFFFVVGGHAASC